MRGAYPETIFGAGANVAPELSLLSISRLVPKKNLRLLLQSFARAGGGSDGFILNIGGTGPQLEELRELSRELKLDHRIKFLGYIAEADLYKVYTGCTAFVLLDVADYNISLYEALALGRRVIVSDDQEIFDGLSHCENIHRTKLDPAAVAAAMSEALSRSPSPLRSADYAALRELTWDSYGHNILRELKPC